MNLLILFTYLALCIALFKLCRVPLNRWTAPVAVLGGVALLAGLGPALNHFHPYSGAGEHRAIALAVAAPGSGRVSEVLVEVDQRVRRGDPLFRLEAGPAQATEARTADAGYETRLTTVRAPADGYVDALSVSTGDLVTASATRPPLRILPADGRQLVAWFRPRDWARLTRGASAEVSFDAIPGVVFGGRLQRVASPREIAPAREFAAAPSGAIPVVIDLTDSRFAAYAEKLPAGSSARAAVYGERLPQLAVVRKVLLRMASWLDYLYPIA